MQKADIFLLFTTPSNPPSGAINEAGKKQKCDQAVKCDNVNPQTWAEGEGFHVPTTNLVHPNTTQSWEMSYLAQNKVFSWRE